MDKMDTESKTVRPPKIYVSELLMVQRSKSRPGETFAETMRSLLCELELERSLSRQHRQTLEDIRDFCKEIGYGGYYKVTEPIMEMLPKGMRDDAT